MQFKHYHPWTLSYAEAVACQERLQPLLRTDVPLDFSSLRTVAGADVAYEPERTQRGHAGESPTARFVAAVVVMKWPTLELVETTTAAAETSFPYIPGLLTFREGPALEQTFARLRTRPDVVICDGQGIAHPRGLGLAAHLGLLLDCPTVGCAKSLFFGVMRGSLGERRGAARALVAPSAASETRGNLTARRPPFAAGERVGTVLRTRNGVKPVWVSCGHLVDLSSAVRLVLRTSRRYRLPEPIRAAHRIVNDALRQWPAD